MKEKIEKAIRETLVIENKESLHYAVDRIMKLIAEETVPKNDPSTSNKGSE